VDLILRNVRLRGQETLVDLGIEGGRFAAIAPQLAATAPQERDAGGQLALPPFVDPHVHLDAVLTVGQPRYNESGTLLEGIQLWAARKATLTMEDVYERARRAVEWGVAQGTLHFRTHVDVGDPQLIAVRALLQLREDIKDIATLQLVAFPQEGVIAYPNGAALLEQALALGVDCVGGIPHYEVTREDGIAQLQQVFELALKYDRCVDIHCDETDDEQSRFLEHVAALTRRYDYQGRVVAGHTTAMHSYNNAYAYKLIGWVARAEVSVIANPLDNAILQGRFDTYPQRRGLTRVKELQAAGVNVGLGHDSIMDPWYPWGRGQMLQAAFVLLHMCQMSGRAEQQAVLDMITVANARALKIADYGIAVGHPADLLLFDLPSEWDLWRLLPLPVAVFKAGKLIAQTPPAVSQVYRTAGATWQPVNFLP
jgi:cytosine/creatinine deaminase